MSTKKQYLVLGAGRFGTALATTLYQMDHEVVVVDDREDVIEDIMHRVTHVMIADATDENILRQLGAQNFDTVIVAIGQDLEANILATVAAKAIGAPYVISKARNAVAAQVLSKVGADQVVQPEHDMGVRLAKQLHSPSVLEALDLGENYAVLEVQVTMRLAGPLGELKLPKRFGIQVITVDRNGDITVSPNAEFVLQKQDNILLLGTKKAVDRLQEYLAE
ncbi:MAG: TrkA family potassium uptake protein [Chloroflexota bacterium]